MEGPAITELLRYLGPFLEQSGPDGFDLAVQPAEEVEGLGGEDIGESLVRGRLDLRLGRWHRTYPATLKCPLT
jgi:hypothetical protein